jgi:hypothetical protein
LGIEARSCVGPKPEVLMGISTAGLVVHFPLRFIRESVVCTEWAETYLLISENLPWAPGSLFLSGWYFWARE